MGRSSESNSKAASFRTAMSRPLSRNTVTISSLEAGNDWILSSLS